MTAPSHRDRPFMNSTPAPVPELSREKARQYERDGVCIVPSVVPPELLARTIPRMEAVMRGEYETGRAPLDSWWKPGDSPGKLRKIDQAHVSDRTIFETVTHPGIGRWVAAITGAKLVQIWAVQMLDKPAGGSATAAVWQSGGSAVGWHQDFFYWQPWWTPDSELLTAWLAVSDVREECGPMQFAAGSHRWGLVQTADSTGSLDHSQRQVPVPPGATWSKVSGAMPAGAFSLHHRLTLHGSQPNVSAEPRRSFAIHLRTEKSTPLSTRDTNPQTCGYDYAGFLDDPAICPVIYRA